MERTGRKHDPGQLGHAARLQAWLSPTEVEIKKNELRETGGHEQNRKPGSEDPREVRRALNELEEAGARYQRMLAAFAAKYKVSHEGPAPPKRARKSEDPRAENDPIPGPSNQEPIAENEKTETGRNLNNTTMELPQASPDMGDDDDAVEVREAEPEGDGTGSWLGGVPDREVPTFTFSPPIPVRWLPKPLDELGERKSPVLRASDAHLGPDAPGQTEARPVLQRNQGGVHRYSHRLLQQDKHQIKPCQTS